MRSLDRAATEPAAEELKKLTFLQERDAWLSAASAK